MRRLRCWALIKARAENAQDGEGEVVGIFANEEQCAERAAVETVDAIPHYRRWAELRGMDPTLPDSRIAYADAMGIKDDALTEGYRAVRMDLSKEEVLAMLRAAVGCEPIGCSFETPDEAKRVAQANGKEEG